MLASYGRISSDFNDLENASWLVTSYVLAMSVAMPMYGKLSDIFGRSFMMIIASTLFALGWWVHLFESRSRGSYANATCGSVVS